MKTETVPDRVEHSVSGLVHIYIPWSLPGHEGLPPVGAKALCGHVRSSNGTRTYTSSDPRACHVCSELVRSPN